MQSPCTAAATPADNSIRDAGRSDGQQKSGLEARDFCRL
jgi:hypothetical protein